MDAVDRLFEWVWAQWFLYVAVGLLFQAAGVLRARGRGGESRG